jgi:hypothetical protein
MRNCIDCKTKFKPFVHNQSRCRSCVEAQQKKEGSYKKIENKKYHRDCDYCGENFEMTGPASRYCSNSCRKHYTRANLYNLTLEEYKEVISVNKCEICEGDSFKMSPHEQAEQLCIDHCENTGTVRGLLCHNCNRAIGLLGHKTEWLRKAASYLERAETIPEGSRGKRLEARNNES